MIDIQLPFNNHSHIVTWLDPDKMSPKLNRDLFQVILTRWLKIIEKSPTLVENYSNCRIWILGISVFLTNFWLIKSDLSGNTVWVLTVSLPNDYFWHFWLTFVDPNCKRSSLRLQYWMRLFGNFQPLWLEYTTFRVDKSSLKMPKWSIWRVFEKLKLSVKQCYQTNISVKYQKLIIQMRHLGRFSNNVHHHCMLENSNLFWPKK